MKTKHTIKAPLGDYPPYDTSDIPMLYIDVDYARKLLLMSNLEPIDEQELDTELGVNFTTYILTLAKYAKDRTKFKFDFAIMDFNIQIKDEVILTFTL